MLLFNADGSPSELSGNGVRCLGALVARDQRSAAGRRHHRRHGRGRKASRAPGERRSAIHVPHVPWPARRTFAAWHSRRPGNGLTATVLGMGNPQCVVLGSLPDAERVRAAGAGAGHARRVSCGHERRVRRGGLTRPEVRILIWERGVGPTTSSGTGTAASAVAAAAHGGASRDMQVIAPGGTQRVEWRDDGVYLTGWAEVVFAGEWLAPRHWLTGDGKQFPRTVYEVGRLAGCARRPVSSEAIAVSRRSFTPFSAAFAPS